MRGTIYVVVTVLSLMTITIAKPTAYSEDHRLRGEGVLRFKSISSPVGSRPDTIDTDWPTVVGVMRNIIDVLTELATYVGGTFEANEGPTEGKFLFFDSSAPHGVTQSDEFMTIFAKKGGLLAMSKALSQHFVRDLQYVTENQLSPYKIPKFTDPEEHMISATIHNVWKLINLLPEDPLGQGSEDLARYTAMYREHQGEQFVYKDIESLYVIMANIGELESRFRQLGSISEADERVVPINEIMSDLNNALLSGISPGLTPTDPTRVTMLAGLSTQTTDLYRSRGPEMMVAVLMTVVNVFKEHATALIKQTPTVALP